MSWGAIGAAAIGGAVSIGTTMYQNEQKKKNAAGSGGNIQNTLPAFYEDPSYKSSQDYLSKLGINVLEGEIPEYYSAMGESGSEEFEKMLGMTTRDIQKAGLESSAMMGKRSPAVAGGISQTIGDVSGKLRYEDYARALQGKQYLFGQGRGITEGVRSAGLTRGQAQNAYNIAGAGVNMNVDKYNSMLNESITQQENAMWASAMESGIGALGTGVGAYMSRDQQNEQIEPSSSGGSEWVQPSHPNASAQTNEYLI